MKLSPVLIACMIIACKPQEKSQQTDVSRQLQTITEYKPNPDDVVLFLTMIESEQSASVWNSKVEVKRQMRAGFSYKNRLSPGEVISLTSKEKLPSGDFYCAAEYQMEPNGGTYVFKTLLKR